MAGEVKHQWNGSVLTVISDSGASSADLRGPKGETGPRGPQGPAGVIYNDDGDLEIDLSIFYTTGEVDEMFERNTPDLSVYATKTALLEAEENLSLAIENKTVDLSGYATEKYVDTQIANVATGGSINLDNYYTKSEIDNGIKLNADEKTIITGEDGKIATAIGGYYKGNIFNVTGLDIADSNGNGAVLITLENIHEYIDDYQTYYVKLIYNDGFIETGSITKTSGSTTNEYLANWSFKPDANFSRANMFYMMSFFDERDDFLGVMINKDYRSFRIKEFYLWDKDMGYVPIDPNFIPIDGISISLNPEGKLIATGVSGGSVDLSAYATKEYVDNKIGSGGGSGADLSGYATIDYVDDKIAAIKIPSGGSKCCVGNTSSSTANGAYAHASGYNTGAHGSYSTAAGLGSEAYGDYAIAAGEYSNANGDKSIALGYSSYAKGQYSIAQGYQSYANGNNSLAIGYLASAGRYINNIPTGGYCSQAFGNNTVANGNFQMVSGVYNIIDENDKYLHIVGNGNSNARANAYTLDRDGNGCFAGTVEATGLILASPNGTRFMITVNDNGALNAVSL